jgi:hypothetical protein
MTTREAADLIESLASRNPEGWHTWIDPTHVATDYWRTGALSDWPGRASGPPADGHRADVAAVELWLERPHPAFKVIVAIDKIGIWYGDGHGGPPDMPIEHLGLIPWWQVSRMVMHRATTRARDAAPAPLAARRSR